MSSYVFYRLKEAALTVGFPGGPATFLKFLKKEQILSPGRTPLPGYEGYFVCYFFENPKKPLKDVKKVLVTAAGIRLLKAIVSKAKQDGKI
jgi:hypothetical protein